MEKKLIPWIVYNKEIANEIPAQGAAYEAYGADWLYVSYSGDTLDDSDKEEFLKTAGELAKQVDIPIIISCPMKRFEDVKKALYTGAKAMAVNTRDLKELSTLTEEGQQGQDETSAMKALKEASARFGKEKIFLEVQEGEDNNSLLTWAEEFVSAIILEKGETQESSRKLPETTLPFFIKKVCLSCQGQEEIQGNQEELQREQEAGRWLKAELSKENIEGIITGYRNSSNLYAVKKFLKAEGIPVNTYESSIPFSVMKKNSEGLLPVVVQDYKTMEVLMVAYMNEEAYNMTIETGRMTYYSRSRSKLWIKGETSGHFQYVKSLTVDCDRDTLLARVRQIGPACHTGSPTCFFEETYKKPYDTTNPLTVLDEVYGVIIDRKEHPKEGSYTNYLFDKGIDKILKKCGEEAAEIIIAAKNPDSSELKYEISDFLYHMMVLMAECGLDWKDIVKELAHRR